MPDETLASPASGGPVGKSIGQRTLKELIDDFLPNIYPTVTVIHQGQAPTSVKVFGIVKQIEPNDGRINTTLDKLKFSDLLDVISEYTFKVTRYDNGAAATSVVYTLTGKSSSTADVGSLSMNAIVALLGQIDFKVSAGGQSPVYTITGTSDDVEPNPHLDKPIGPFSAKYIFLLKKLYRFTVTKVGGPPIFATMDGNKTTNE